MDEHDYYERCDHEDDRQWWELQDEQLQRLEEEKVWEWENEK